MPLLVTISGRWLLARERGIVMANGPSKRSSHRRISGTCPRVSIQRPDDLFVAERLHLFVRFGCIDLGNHATLKIRNGGRDQSQRVEVAFFDVGDENSRKVVAHPF